MISSHIRFFKNDKKPCIGLLYTKNESVEDITLSLEEAYNLAVDILIHCRHTLLQDYKYSNPTLQFKTPGQIIEVPQNWRELKKEDCIREITLLANLLSTFQEVSETPSS